MIGGGRVRPRGLGRDNKGTPRRHLFSATINRVTTPPRRPLPPLPGEAGLLRSIYRPLLEDAHREVELALKVAYALEHDMKPADIADRLDITAGAVKSAASQVKRARGRLERGE